MQAFPAYLEAAISHASDARIRAELEDDLRDELHEPAPHDALWLDFAERLGLDREAVRSAAPHAAAEAIVSTFSDLARESLAGGLAALYFDVHEAADVRHRQGERDALAACLAAGTPPEAVERATERALDAYWGLLDGVCREVGIPA